VLDHVDKEDLSLFDTENNPVATIDSSFQIVLFRLNRLDSKARGKSLFEEGERRGRSACEPFRISVATSS
jgi:hypothetical protein